MPDDLSLVSELFRTLEGQFSVKDATMVPEVFQPCSLYHDYLYTSKEYHVHILPEFPCT